LKKNHFLRAAALLLACCMFSLCTITGTMAKFIKPLGSAEADIVRAGYFEVVAYDGTDWVSLVTAGLGSGLEVDLFDTICKVDAETPHNDDPLAPTIVEDPKVIAPGTGGKFKIIVVNLSECAVDVTMALGAALPTNVPLQWLGTPPSTGGTTFHMAAGPLASSVPVEFEFKWYWDFGTAGTYVQAVDGPDTLLGVNQAEYTLPLKITAVQRG